MFSSQRNGYRSFHAVPDVHATGGRRHGRGGKKGGRGRGRGDAVPFRMTKPATYELFVGIDSVGGDTGGGVRGMEEQGGAIHRF